MEVNIFTAATVTKQDIAKHIEGFNKHPYFAKAFKKSNMKVQLNNSYDAVLSVAGVEKFVMHGVCDFKAAANFGTQVNSWLKENNYKA